MQIRLDEKDLEIIRILKDDSRASVRKISEMTGIRPSTVHTRIKKLRENGVIEKFTVKLNEEMVGNALTVFMLISGSLDRYLDKEMQANENIREIYGITGEYDLLMKLKFKSMREFNNFVIEFRERYSNKINKTITMVQTVKLKED